MPANTGEFPQVHDSQPVCVQRFLQIEKRLDKLERDEWRGEIKGVAEKVDALAQQMANLNGRIAGYLVAGGILGAILSGTVQFVLRK
jgi:hypothetical protein